MKKTNITSDTFQEWLDKDGFNEDVKSTKPNKGGESSGNLATSDEDKQVKEEHVAPGVYDLHTKTSSKDSMSLHVDGSDGFQDLTQAQQEMNNILDSGPLNSAAQRRGVDEQAAVVAGAAEPSPTTVMLQDFAQQALQATATAPVADSANLHPAHIGADAVFGFITVVAVGTLVLAVLLAVGTGAKWRRALRDERRKSSIGDEEVSPAKVGEYSDSA